MITAVAPSRGVKIGRRSGVNIASRLTRPERYGPHTTCVNRFNRWRKVGVWDRLLEAVSKAHDGDIQMIDSSSIRVHQHAANAQKKRTDPVAWAARGAA
jgi:transposase